MGIVVPDLVARVGLTVPQAYIAISRSTVVMYPGAAHRYQVFTTYKTWVSYESRAQGMRPIDTADLSFVWTPGTGLSLNSMYDTAYAIIKDLFPSYEDYQPAEEPPAEEPPAEEPPAEEPPAEEPPAEEPPAEEPPAEEPPAEA